MKTVLVTAVGGDIGADVLRCLKESGRALRLLGCDLDPAGRAAAAEFHPCPPAREEEAYLGFLESLVERERIDVVFPTSEAELTVLDHHRDRLKRAGVTCAMNGSAALLPFLDKLKTVELLGNRAVPCPRTVRAAEFRGQFPLPAIVKPRAGRGSQRVFLASDEEELRFYLKRSPDAVVQQAVGTPEEEYTMGVFSDGTEVRSILLKRQLGLGGLSRRVELAHSPEAEEIARQVAAAAQLRGSLNVQMRKVGKGFMVFEVNPRLSSTAYFRHRLGFTDAVWWLDLALGQKPAPYAPRYRKAVGVRTLSAELIELDPDDGGRTPVELESDRLKLRTLDPKDASEDYARGLNDPEVNRYLDVRVMTQTVDSVRRYIEANQNDRRAWLFGLFPKGEDRLIGTVRLHDLNAYHRSAIVGVCLFSKAHWGKGLGSEAVSRVARFAFEQLGLHYLEAGCYAENKGSQNLFLKVGFHEIARYPEKYRLNGRFAEVIILGLSNPSFDPASLDRPLSS